MSQAERAGLYGGETFNSLKSLKPQPFFGMKYRISHHSRAFLEFLVAPLFLSIVSSRFVSLSFRSRCEDLLHAQRTSSSSTTLGEVSRCEHWSMALCAIVRSRAEPQVLVLRRDGCQKRCYGFVNRAIARFTPFCSVRPPVHRSPISEIESN